MQQWLEGGTEQYRGAHLESHEHTPGLLRSADAQYGRVICAVAVAGLGMIIIGPARAREVVATTMASARELPGELVAI